MSGSAVADAGGMGVVVIKAMSEQRYRKDLAGAITVAAATMPPFRGALWKGRCLILAPEKYILWLGPGVQDPDRLQTPLRPYPLRR